MKKLACALLLIIGINNAFAQKQFVVDANATVRPVEQSFHAISVSGGIDLYLSQSEKEGIAVSANNDKNKDLIKTVVENGVLRIYTEHGTGWGKDKKMNVYVSFKDIDNLDVSGSSDVTVAGTIKGNSLRLSLSGSSDLDANVQLNDLEMNLSGASDVRIQGTAANYKVESNGASDVKGYGLVTEFTTAHASGASDINITVNKELRARASGASNIYYKGSGEIKEQQSSGASSIAHKN